MQRILIVFFIVNFIILIFSFPLKTRLIGHFNLVDFIGFYSLKVMKIKIVNGKIEFVNGDLVVNNSVNLINIKFEKNFSKKVFKQLTDKIEIKKLEIYFSGGVADNSFASAMICGSINSLIKSVFGVLSQKYYSIKLYEDVDARFANNDFEITFDFVASVTILSLIVSIIKALGEKKEVESEG